jgi:four helix bundle protein
VKGDNIAERMLQFGVRVIKLSEALPKRFAAKHIALQLLRSGTSAGANCEEARGAESRADFIHKLGVSWKEARESRYWLQLIQRAELVKPSLLSGLVQEAEELSKILARSLGTLKRPPDASDSPRPKS